MDLLGSTSRLPFPSLFARLYYRCLLFEQVITHYTPNDTVNSSVQYYEAKYPFRGARLLFTLYRPFFFYFPPYLLQVQRTGLKGEYLKQNYKTL